MRPILAVESAPRASARPREDDDKSRYVREMFAGIAHRYDLLNDILSFRRHHAWRKAAARLTGLRPGGLALDVCAGTGDFALALARIVGEGGAVVATDFCLPMLALTGPKAGRATRVPVGLLAADALRLPFHSDAFDAATVGFGIRNVADVTQAIGEMARVVRPGGTVTCLEFTQPQGRLAGRIVGWYQEIILPRIGALLSSGDAYRYLPRSIRGFHSARELAGIMESVGLSDVRVRHLNFGSVCIHVGTKR